MQSSCGIEIAPIDQVIFQRFCGDDPILHRASRPLASAHGDVGVVPQCPPNVLLHGSDELTSKEFACRVVIRIYRHVRCVPLLNPIRMARTGQSEEGRMHGQSMSTIS